MSIQILDLFLLALDLKLQVVLLQLKLLHLVTGCSGLALLILDRLHDYISLSSELADLENHVFHSSLELQLVHVLVLYDLLQVENFLVSRL